VLTRARCGWRFASPLWGLPFKLMVPAVFQMSDDIDRERLRPQWGAAEELPAFARVGALIVAGSP
jgi:hypothetical protein